jgi:hypothetical protein
MLKCASWYNHVHFRFMVWWLNFLISVFGSLRYVRLWLSDGHFLVVGHSVYSFFHSHSYSPPPLPDSHFNLFPHNNLHFSSDNACSWNGVLSKKKKTNASALYHCSDLDYFLTCVSTECQLLWHAASATEVSPPSNVYDGTALLRFVGHSVEARSDTRSNYTVRGVET